MAADLTQPRKKIVAHFACVSLPWHVHAAVCFRGACQAGMQLALFISPRMARARLNLFVVYYMLQLVRAALFCLRLGLFLYLAWPVLVCFVTVSSEI